ncbi:MAG TPA: ATP-binding protein [Nakamurella sp.]|nr:ATP-binding protein [Nakamurella sp.]
MTATGPAPSASPAIAATSGGQIPPDARVAADPTGSSRPTGDAVPGSESADGDRSPTGARHHSGGSASGLRARLIVLVVAVAVLVALVFTVAAVFLVRGTLTDAGTAVLADQANLVAAGLPADPTARGAALESMSSVLERQGVVVVPIGADGALPTSDRLAVQAARDAGAGRAVGGASVSGTSSVGVGVGGGGDVRLVEARSTASGGFALVTLADGTVPLQDSLQRRLLAALLIGTVVAIVAGLFAARSLSASLRRTAALATSMSGGDLQVRIPITGPREVAEVSATLNGMADALQRSETGNHLRRQPVYGGPAAHSDRVVVPPPAPQPAGPPPPDEFADGPRARSVGLLPMSQEVSQSDGPNPALGGLVPITDETDEAGETVGAPGPDPRSVHLDLGPTDLRALVTQVGQAWRARCDSAGIPLIVDVPVESVVVISDTRRLRQVLDELAENAQRVLEPGQPLILHLGREAAPASSGTPVGRGTAVLQVRDGGPGLTSEDFPVVFQQGVLRERYRGRRPGGAGLGLALVHRLIVRLGGSIVASPAPEGGVAMTIRLPITAGGAP